MEVNEADAKYLVAVRRRPTELGALPGDWAVIELAARATIQSGIAKNANAALRDPVAVPYLRVANVQDGYLDLREVALIEIERSDLNRYAVLPGDVLMNEGGDLDKLGRGALWHGQINPCVHQNHVFVVRCKTGLVPEYLNAWTSTAQARRYFMQAGRQTTNLASINKTSLGELTVAVPPTEHEQHQIAKAISDADALIDSLEQLLTKKRQIKQGAMQELLSGKRRLPGFDGEWELKRLGEMAQLMKGSGLSKDATTASGRRKCILYGELFTTYGQVILDVVSRTNSSDGLVSTSGDVLVPGSTTTDGIDLATASALLESGVALGGDINVIRPRSDESFDPRFLANYLTHVKKREIAERAQGTTIVHLYGRDLSDLWLHQPNLFEQGAIAQVLSDMDAELAALESRLTKAHALKQAMAQALLTGRIRIPLSPQEPAVPVPPPEGVGALGNDPARTQEPTA